MSYPWTNLLKLETEHAALQEECDRWKALVVIGCEEDENVKRMARPFLTDLEIDGDKNSACRELWELLRRCVRN